MPVQARLPASALLASRARVASGVFLIRPRRLGVGARRRRLRASAPGVPSPAASGIWPVSISRAVVSSPARSMFSSSVWVCSASASSCAGVWCPAGSRADSSMSGSVGDGRGSSSPRARLLSVITHPISRGRCSLRGGGGREADFAAPANSRWAARGSRPGITLRHRRHALDHAELPAGPAVQEAIRVADHQRGRTMPLGEHGPRRDATKVGGTQGRSN